MNKLYRSTCSACKNWCIFSWEPRGDLMFTTCTHCGHEEVQTKTVKQMQSLVHELESFARAYADVVPELRTLKKPGDHIALGPLVKPTEPPPLGYLSES